MDENLKGKVAVVAGSGQGIGRSIAIAMGKEGAKVVTNNRKPGSTGFAIMDDALVNNLSNEEKEALKQMSESAAGDAETTAKIIRDGGGKAVPFFGDTSDFNTAKGLIQTAIDHFGRIDILVNVVGTFAFSPIWEMSEETWDKVCHVKPKAHFNCIRHALPFMIEQRFGRIINCTSGAFNGGGIRQANYSAANAGVVGLTYAVAQEVIQFGITCNAFAPNAQTRASFEITAYEKAMPEGKGPWVYDNYRLPLDGAPSPDDLAPFICYLSTDEASEISGSVFFVGGQSVFLYSESEFKSSITKYGEGRWTIEELEQQVPLGLMGMHRSSTMQMYDMVKK
ncbi:MAG: SDR family oxidoreductase [Deltaproteobacteria bacterium]|nr:SDR family oxidoreductase [Deltaproteobacteria bacterium]